MPYGWGWKPYVSVAQRRAKAQRYAAGLAKNGRTLLPVAINGRTIARTFWGQAWCDNLEGYSDFENRLPRGRTYVRNGSVIDLQIARGLVTAIVSGSEIYNVKIEITQLGKAVWTKIKRDCSQSFDSLIDLLQGRFSKGVMERLTSQQGGLFPKPKEISIHCSCPDWAVLCKHAAAVLYGIGARLDSAPDMLFQLRGVDHGELIGQAVDRRNLDAALAPSKNESLADEDLGELFGIDIESPSGADKKPSSIAARARRAKAARSKSTATATTKIAKKRTGKPGSSIVGRGTATKKRAATLSTQTSNASAKKNTSAKSSVRQASNKKQAAPAKRKRREA